MFTREIIDGMDKSQVKAAKGLGSLLNDDDKTMLDARLAVLTAPPAPTPFPKQSQLDEAYAQLKAWSETIKGLHAEARAGNHTFTNGDGQTVKPGKTRKATSKPTASVVAIVIDGQSHKSFTAAAEALKDVRPDLSRTVSRNWRPEVMAAKTGVVKIKGITAEEYAAYFPIPEGRDWTYEEVE